MVADHIVSDLRPHTVLDAGCAMGYLVAALRDRGVEAYGIDISDYAISKVREDIRPYCIVGSLTEPLPSALPKQYDLVVTIEVLEHLYAEEGRIAIRNLCRLSDTILFSSTPDDFTEHTHVNVQQREYWAHIFAEEKFLDDINYRPTYLTYYASVFRRERNWVRQVEDYERNIRMTEGKYRTEVANWSKAIEDKERHIQNQNAALEQLRSERDDLAKQFMDTTAERTALAERLDAAEAERTALAERLDAATAECAALTERLDAATAERTALTERLDAANLEKDSLTAELKTSEQAYSHLLDKQEKLSQTRSVLLKKLTEAKKAAAFAETALTETEALYAHDKAELAHYKEHYLAAINQREALKLELAAAQNAYNAISNATFWKITKPFRVVVEFFRRIPAFGLFAKGVRSLREHGVRYTWKRVMDRRAHRLDYRAAAQRQLYTEAELEAQKTERFSKDIKFSIVVPLYNTPSQFLHEMIRSVLDQTYGNWELCMADGSDSKHGEVEKICLSYVRKDRRILYQKLDKNFGISGNTNACLDMASGDYIGLFDHDDLLHPAALYDVMHAICDKGADFVYTDENTFHHKPEDADCPNFKPDFAPDTLRSYNYICHFSVFSVQLLKEAGGKFRSEFDGSQDYDMILRLTEKAEKIVHIPKILYYWRGHAGSVASDVSAKPYTMTAAKKALGEHLKRVGLNGEVLDATIPSTYRMKYCITGNPKISILIPNKDHIDDLKKCVDSIREKSTYQNWEIIIIENNSEEQSTFDFYKQLEKDARIRVVRWKRAFNYSAINNYGAKTARGEHILLLNNDIEVITPDWMEQMLMFSQRKDVGAVGAMLYYPDDTIQHGGVIVGLGGVAGHSHKYFQRGHCGYMYRLAIAQNLSAVTAACLMLRRSVWKKVSGLDESFQVAFNDVDFCMRIRKAGYLIVWTPFAELYHYESKSRGLEDTPEKQKRFQGEVERFQKRWAKELAAGDPYYNPNLTLDREDFSLR